MAKGYGRAGGHAMGSMKNQLASLQKQMQEQQEKIAAAEVTASVGGGALKIVMSGDQICKSVTIDPDFLKDTDAEMLQDLLLTGINSALEQSKALSDNEMNSLTGGLASGLSGLGINLGF